MQTLFRQCVLSVFTQFFLFSYTLLIVPLAQNTSFWIQILLSLYQDIFKSRLLEHLPSWALFCWNNLIFYFVNSTIIFVVILKHSNIFHNINILLWAFNVKLLPQFSVLRYHLSKWLKYTLNNQSNCSSSME